MLTGVQRLYGGGESAVVQQYRRNHGDDTYQHNDALNEIVDGRCHIAAEDDVDTGQHRHRHHNHPVGDGEHVVKQRGKAVIQRCGVGDEEDKDNHRSDDLQRFGIVPLFEEVRHGFTAQMLGHHTGAPSQHRPGQQRADKGVAEADPRRCQTEIPTKLTGIAHEDHRREVRSAKGKGSEPRADGAAAQHEPFHVGGMLAAGQSHADHQRKKGDEHRNGNPRCRG